MSMRLGEYATRTEVGRDFQHKLITGADAQETVLPAFNDLVFTETYLERLFAFKATIKDLFRLRKHAPVVDSHLVTLCSGRLAFVAIFVANS